MQFNIIYELGSEASQAVIPVEISLINEGYTVDMRTSPLEFNTSEVTELVIQNIDVKIDEPEQKDSIKKVPKKSSPESASTSSIYVPYEDGEVQRIEVSGHRLTRNEIDYERWLWAIGFSDFLIDPRNDYEPDPTDGAVYYNNTCTNSAHTSPPPTNLPAGMDSSKLNELRNLVNAAADEIKAMPNQSIEYGIVFYLTDSGKIRRDEIFSGTADSLDVPYYHGNLQMMIAFVHSHPTKPGEVKEAWRPSTPGNAASEKSDQTQMNEWIMKGHADPHALAYIVDGSGSNGNGSGDVFEYTMAGPLTPRPKGANISKDCVK